MSKTIAFISVIIFLLSCGQNRPKEKDERNEQDKMSNKIQVDTSLIAILPYDTTQYWIFKNATQSSLSLPELKQVGKMLIDCIEKYNIKQKQRYEKLNNEHPEYDFDINQFTIDLKSYKRQYICVVNNKGQKEVWINCFCETFGTNWRKEEIEVMDGGNCFFNLKVNIDKNEYYEFMVNGVA